MFKRALIMLAVAVSVAAAIASASAQGQIPFEVTATRQSSSGLDRTFAFDVKNKTGRDLFARGRAVLLNVYDASLPTTILVPDVSLPSHGTATVSIKWTNAPLVGQIRALLVLNDGQDPSLVESFAFWIFPFRMAAIFAGLLLAALFLALTILRLPKFLKARVPSNMVPYLVENDDTVVTLSARYDVTWQDIVRANRLRPPYELKPGQRIFIPKHDLRRPNPEQAP